MSDTIQQIDVTINVLYVGTTTKQCPLISRGENNDGVWSRIGIAQLAKKQQQRSCWACNFSCCYCLLLGVGGSGVSAALICVRCLLGGKPGAGPRPGVAAAAAAPGERRPPEEVAKGRERGLVAGILMESRFCGVAGTVEPACCVAPAAAPAAVAAGAGAGWKCL